jgi:hypothetical protein
MVPRPTPVGQVSCRSCISVLGYVGKTHSSESSLQYIPVHSWLTEIILYDIDGYVMTLIGHNLRVMHYLAYHFVQVIFCWDPHPSLVIRRLVQVFYICASSAVLCCFVDILQFLILPCSRNYTFYQVCIEFNWWDCMKF